MSEYDKASILFLHLNDYEAFYKVLPSKIFEYATTGKPIIAGVNGFAKDVISKLPMEFAVEANNLLAVTLEGSVG